MHVLKIGTTGDYAPFSFYKKKKLVGVDIDLAIHFAKFANKKIKFIKTSWPALTSDVKDNKFDLALSGICPTNDRKKIGLVSNNICTSYKTLFINKKWKNKIKTLHDIKVNNLKIIVNPGGTNQVIVNQNFEKKNILINNSNDKIPKIIDSGGGDVMVTDIWEYKYYAKFLKNIFQLNKIRFSSDHMVCFTNKNNREILKLFNKFLVSIKKNGFLHKTIKKYCA